MRIGELARRTGVPAKTIRYYEGIGILPEPDRASNGYREYDDAAVDQLTFIRDAQATGLSLTEISSVLEMRRQGLGSCQHVIALMDCHLQQLEHHIEALHRTRERLAVMTERARRLDPADCTDPSRCQTIAPMAAAGARSGVTAQSEDASDRHR